MKTCRLIASIADQFKRWSSRESYRDLSRHFHLPNTIGNLLDEIKRFPQSTKIKKKEHIGALDGSEIEIRQPL
jgi:hypothetical protein